MSCFSVILIPRENNDSTNIKHTEGERIKLFEDENAFWISFREMLLRMLTTGEGTSMENSSPATNQG